MGQVSAGVRKPQAEAESCRQHQSRQPLRVSVHTWLSNVTGQSHTEFYSKERATQANLCYGALLLSPAHFAL